MTIKYRPEIDGMRAIAVGSVVLFHADLRFFSGGYIGVDIFFVISGFLITSILLEDLAEGRFSMLRFYERRARRISPALIVATLLTIIAAPLLLDPDQTTGVFRSAAATALFIANVRFWLSTDYFAPAAEERPLLHMWSLAVEEQFYIVFPIFLYLLWRSRRDRMMFAFILCAALSLMVAEIGWRKWPTANFFLPLGRAWELLAGSIVALQMQSRQPGSSPTSNALGLLGLAMITVPIVFFDSYVPTPSLYMLIPVFGVCLIIRHAGAGTLAARILSLKPLVGIGLISYSMYLYHQPLLAFGRIALPEQMRPYWLLLLLAALSVPLGYLSWRYIEQPTRRRMSVRAIWVLTITGFGSIAMLGASAHLRPDMIEAIYVATLDNDGRKKFKLLEEAKVRKPDIQGACKFWASDANEKFEQRFDGCFEKYGKAIVVLGGSHAGDLHGAIASAFNHPFLIALTKGYCRPHKRLEGPPPHECHYEGVRKFLSRRGADVALVIYTQAYFTLFDSYRDTNSKDGFHPELVKETVEYIASLQPYVPVVMMGPRRTPGFYVPRLSARRDFLEQAREIYNPGTAAAEDLADQTFRAEAASRGIPYISLITALDQQMPEAIFEDGKPLYHDKDHLNALGEPHVGAILRRFLMKSGSQSAAVVRDNLLKMSPPWQLQHNK